MSFLGQEIQKREGGYRDGHVKRADESFADTWVHFEEGLLHERYLPRICSGGVQGVAVAAFQADEFPAFFTPYSGCLAPCRVETPQEAAAMIQASQRLDLGAGLLFGGELSIAHYVSLMCHP